MAARWRRSLSTVTTTDWPEASNDYDRRCASPADEERRKLLKSATAAAGGPVLAGASLLVIGLHASVTPA